MSKATEDTLDELTVDTVDVLAGEMPEFDSFSNVSKIG